MSDTATIDCVLVGYNDVDFERFAATQKEMRQYSGAYHEVKTNSLVWEGRRITYMDLINQVIAKGTGSNPDLNVFEAPLLALCYLGSILRKQGLAVELVNFFNKEKARFRNLLSRRPRAVAITTTFYVDSTPIVELVEFIRRHSPETRIIVGGPHILNLTSDLDEATQDYALQALIGADVYIIDSQGEQTLGQVIQCLRDGSRLEDIPNLYYRDDTGAFRRTERKVENNDLDDNRVDWQLFDKSLVSPIAYLRTARSCPYTCAFCNYPTMAGAYVNSSVETVETELQTLHRMGTTDVVFIDDTFNYPLPRFKRLLRMMIANDFGFRWVSFLRCSNVDEEALDLMQQSGCIGVLLGIESGDQRILQLMSKSAKLDRYVWGIAELKKRGIETFASLICGYPGETEESIRNTISFIEQTGPTFFNVQLYYHDTRAPVSKRAAEFGIEGAGYNWKHNTMDWTQGVAWAEYMFRTIRNSIPLSLYGFSLWGISYLISRGISMDQVKEFGRITRPMLLQSISEEDAGEFSNEERQLISLFERFPVEASVAGLSTSPA